MSDKLAHHVEVKIAAASADFRQRYGTEPAEILEVVRRVAGSRVRDHDQEPVTCPACGSAGVAIDRHGRRRIRHDKANDLLARQAVLEYQDPAIVNDRDVEALPLSAHIDADPSSHK